MVSSVHGTFLIISILTISLLNQLPLVKSLATDALIKCSENVTKSCNAICGEDSCRITKKLNQPVCQCSQYPNNEGQSPENGIQEYECHGDTSCMEVCTDLTSDLTNVFFRPLACAVTTEVLETGTASESSSVCACAIFEFKVSAPSRDVRDLDGETGGDGDREGNEDGEVGGGDIVDIVLEVLSIPEMFTEIVMKVLFSAIKFARTFTRSFLTKVQLSG